MRAILTFHSIDPSGSPISCGPETFARHVSWLASGRVRVTTIEELLKLPASLDAVALTFDDGYTNFRDVAVPRLIEHGVPATVFVAGDLVGKMNSWDAGPRRHTPELPLLDWPALARLQELGVTIGAHGMTHRSLTGLDPEALKHEVRGSADAIERQLGRRPSVFAYSYGHSNAEVARAVAQTFQLACTVAFRTLSAAEEPVALPRLDMYYFQKPGSLDGWGTDWFEARIKLRHGLRRMRTISRALTRGAG